MASKWDMQKKKEDRISAQQNKAKEQEKTKTQERAKEIQDAVQKTGLVGSKLMPITLMRRDAQAGITTQDKIDMAKGSGLAGNKSASEISRQKEAEAKKQEEKQKEQEGQQLSKYDLKELTPGGQQIVREAKVAWEKANAAGDQEGMRKAHEKAEAARRQAGYSGGAGGDEYNAGEITEKEKAVLTPEGERLLRAARMSGNERRAQDILASPLYNAGRQNAGLDAHGRTGQAGAAMTPGEFARRLDAGAKAAAAGAMGSVLALGETAAQATNNRVLDTNRAEVDRLANDLGLWKARLNMVQQGQGLPEWGSESYIQNRIKIAENAQKMRSSATTVDPNLPGQAAMRQARQWQQEATQGLSGVERLLANTAISGGQMLPGIAASFIPVAGPAIGAGIMGAQAAGSKAYDLTDRGIDAREALTRGLASGFIEGATERMGIGNLVKLVARAGGASFLKNIAKQMGIEATEESAAYVLNYAADKAYQDPEAKFSLRELAESAASGAILGGTFGGTGTVINRAMNRPAQTTQRPQGSPQEALLQASGFYDRQAQRATEEAQEAQNAQTQAEALRQANQALQTRLAENRQRLEQIRQANSTAQVPLSQDNSINEEGEIMPIETGTLPGDPSDTISPSELRVTPQSEPVNRELPEGQGAMSLGGAGDFAAWQRDTPGGQFHAINEQGSDMAAELYGRASVEIPTRDPRGMLTSKTVSTLANAGITNNQLVQSLEADAVSGGYSYTAYSDPQAQTDAENYIREMGYQRAKEAWIADAKAGKLSKKNTALGLTLINNAANSGTLEGHIDAHDLIGYYVSYARTAGQALQAMNMVNKMTPTGQLYNLVKTTENLALNIKDRSGKDVDLTIDPELSRQFMEAETQEARDAIKTEIYKDIARQVPNTFMDKANAWRYLAMLGNPRTHVRNIFGNLFFDPVRTTKNVIGAGLERLTGVEDRTKALNTFTAEDRARYRAAQADFPEVQDVVMSGGKYNDDWSQIDEYRRIFKNPLLEGARKANAGALEAEDRFFSRRAYADSLSGWLKANGFTGEEYLSESFDPAEKERARQYAIKEAQKATYRDLNAASELVLSAGQLRNSQNKAKRAAGFFVEGVLPFKKTPTNILVRGLEYSPAGLTKGVVDAATKVRQGKMDAAEAIDEIAAGLTGTGLLAFGAGLAAAGLVSGGASGDDKQDEFNELQGHQNYALEVGDTSYTIDWLAPEALPFFVGVELQKFVSGLREGKTERKDWAKAVTRIAEPMLEMSMLQSLNDVINSVGSDVPLVSAVASAAMSYLGQFVPTLGGQIERTFLEDTRQSTYVDRDSAVPTSVQYMLGTIGNKIPGVDFYQREYVDAWGRPESTGTILNRALSNFVSPGYVSKINSTGVDQDLQRLYDAGFDSVFPTMTQTNKQVADRTSGQEDAKRYMTGQEFNTMQTTKGQTAFNILDKVIRSDSYRGMSDQEKAKLVDRVYDYAGSQGDLAVDSQKEVDNWVTNAAKAADVGMDIGDFFVAYNKKNQIDSDDTKDAGQKALDLAVWIDQQPYTADQKSFLKDSLKIYSHIPANTDRYEKGVAAGLTPDQARSLTQSAKANNEGASSLSYDDMYNAVMEAAGGDTALQEMMYQVLKPKNYKQSWATVKANHR